jgi:hypothetical protein
MEDPKKEHWMVLCEQAATEQDPHRLMQLIAEIDRLLREKEQRLTQRSGSESAA